MTNNIVTFDFNGVKVVKDANTKLLELITPGNTAANLSFHGVPDDANYQVPSAKKATIIFITTYVQSGLSKIIYADNADGVTNAVDLFSTVISAQDFTNLLFISIEVPALKFINVRVASGTVNAGATIHVIEEDA